VRFASSEEKMMASAGARYTKDAPWINGNLDPKDVCRRVDSPDTMNMLDKTLAVSSCQPKKPPKK
jgi:hypothetical protein